MSRRLLLDDNLPRPMVRMLDRFNVRTAAEEGWATLVNGKLLVLSSNAGPVIQPAGEPIIDAVADAAPGSYTAVSLPRPPLNRRPAP